MADIELLKKLGTIRKFNADDYIFCQGDCGNEMYIILSGRVDVYISSFNGYPIKISEMGPGAFFGELSLLDDQPRSASVVACNATVVIAIDRDKFQSFISNQPQMAYRIMKGLSARIRSLNEEICRLREGKDINGNEEEEDRAADSGAHEKKDAREGAVNNPGALEPAAFDDSIYLKGHKVYGKPEPGTYKQFVLDKKGQCPVCSTDFTFPIPRVSKLRLSTVEPDSRKVYHDFDPLWYSIWVCPGCGYSNYYFDFEDIPAGMAKTLEDKLKEIKGRINGSFTSERTLDQVLTAYYLAIFSAGCYKSGTLKLARLWLQLSWLYRDAEDSELQRAAAMNALELYYQAVYRENINIPVEQEQQCFLILGELFLIKGDKSEALKQFRLAIKRSAGSQLLNDQARNRIQDIRDMG